MFVGVELERDEKIHVRLSSGADEPTPARRPARVHSAMRARARKVYWTYHVNMRLAGRHILRDDIFEAVDSCTVVESNPDDKYLPSYLLLATPTGAAFHVLLAADVEGDNVRVITAYHPSPEEWEPDLRTRRGKP